MSSVAASTATAARAALDDSSIAWPLASTSAAPNDHHVVCEGGAAVLFRTGEVFYNPVQLFNRDLSVLAIRAWDEVRTARASARDRARAWGQRGLAPPADGSMPPLRIFEALSATGLRSIRYASELPPDRVALIVANDLEPTAARAIATNAAFNGARAAAIVPNAGDAILVAHLTARGLPLLPGMDAWCVAPPRHAKVAADDATKVEEGAEDSGSGSRPTPFLFDNVDLDPYGTAAPFLDSAIGTLADGGLLAVTCTDMSVLAGTHMDACRAKYGSIPVRARHFGEQALRILLASIEAAANRRRRSIKALSAVCVDFYIRVFVTVHDSPADAATSGARMSNIHQCSGCDAFWMWPLGKYGRFAPRSPGLLWPGSSSKLAAPAPAAVEAAPAAAEEEAESAVEGSAAIPGRVNNDGKEDDKHALRGSRRAAKRDRAGVTLSSAPADAPGANAPAPRPSVVGANVAPDLPCACPHCGRPITVGGPVWSGPLHDPDFLASLEKLAVASFGTDGAGGVDDGSTWLPRPSADAAHYYALHARSAARSATDGGSNGVSTTAASRRRLLGVLRSLREELPDAPLYYEVGSLASRVRASTRPLADVFAAIENAGYRASGSHAAPNSLKTDAPPSVVMEIVRAMRGERAAPGGDQAKLDPAGASFVAPKRAHASFAGAGATLAAMPLDEAIFSPLSLRPTEMEWPLACRPTSFQHTQALLARLAARREERERGEGQRFVPNPGANWGPKARATGSKSEK
jgi:tRNA G26 N,N-dimethylase Trm1